MTALQRDLFSGVGAGAVQMLGAALIDFAGLHALSDAAIAIAPAVLAYIGLQLALPRPRTVLDEVRDLRFTGIDEEEFATTLSTARAQVRRLRELGEEVQGDSAARVDEIAAIAERIVEGFKEDPSDIRRSRTFLRHYLGGTVELVEKYVALQAKAEHSDNARVVLGKFDEGLADMQRLFEQQYDKNLADDVADFDVHLEVFQTLARQEGV